MPRAQRSGWKKMPEGVRREAILSAAAAAFGALGFEKASVQDIAERAGLTKGGVYFHFGSKEAIRTGLLLSAAARAEAALGAEAEGGGDDPATQLLALLHAVSGAFEAAGMTPLKLMMLAGGEAGPGRAALMNFHIAFHARLAWLIAQAQAAGAATKRLPPATLARLLLALFDGLQVQAELVPEQIGKTDGVPALLKASVLKLLLEEPV